MNELVLVIEDETGIVDLVRRGLESQGFDVRSAPDGASGLERALGDGVDLVVLDLMLPRRSGMEVQRELRRAKPRLPVIVLTARGEIDDRVAGLDAGAVDYLTKPFSLEELAARIRAQLRVAAAAPDATLQAGEVEVDLLSREVRCAGRPVRLSRTEFELFVHLIRNRGRVLSRAQILQAVWGSEHDPGTNIVDVYVGYLRRKLRAAASVAAPPTSGAAAPPRSSSIITVRSVGYRFDAAA